MCFMKRNSPYLRNKREFHIFLFQGKVKLSTDQTLHLIHLIINPSMQKFSKQLLINYKQPTSHFNSLFGKKNQHLIFWQIQHYYKLSTQKKGTRKKNVLIKQRILCIHKLAQRTAIKAFFYLDEITQYYSDTMKIHVLSDIAQEILHHEIYTYLSFGCT